jgi:hypothetical protein
MPTYQSLLDALNELAPNKQWTFKNQDIETLVWGQEYNDAPTISEVIAKAKKLDKASK